MIGEAGVSRTNYNAQERDEVAVAGISSNLDALGYFGLGYYLKRAEELKAVAINAGSGPIMPSIGTVQDQTYPLSRPLFIYVNRERAKNNTELYNFVIYYLRNVEAAVKAAGFVPLSQQEYEDRITQLIEDF